MILPLLHLLLLFEWMMLVAKLNHWINNKSVVTMWQWIRQYTFEAYSRQLHWSILPLYRVVNSFEQLTAKKQQTRKLQTYYLPANIWTWHPVWISKVHNLHLIAQSSSWNETAALKCQTPLVFRCSAFCEFYVFNKEINTFEKKSKQTQSPSLTETD